MKNSLTVVRKDISIPVTEILMAAGIKWKLMIEELKELLKKGHVSMADSKLAEMYRFLNELEKDLNPQIHKELFNNLNNICELIWSQEFIWRNENTIKKVAKLSKMFD